MIKIAFQGEKGAYSEEAAFKYWSGDLTAVPKIDFENVFTAVKSNECDYGIVPVENTLTGSIHENVDLLLNKNLFIIGEILLRVEHNLLVLPGTSINNLVRVYSHPQALSQCSEYLATLGRVSSIPALDTAGSARMIAETGESEAGAIAGKRAAAVYGLEIIASSIENNHENFTRFVILSTKRGPVCSNCKTSVVLGLEDKPGALGHCLAFFAERDINLVKLESRPVLGSPWKYNFYLDFIGDPDQDKCHDALADLENMAEYFKLLGTYPGWKDA